MQFKLCVRKAPKIHQKVGKMTLTAIKRRQLHSADWSRGNSKARGGTPFSDLASKIHTRFQTWPCTWISIAYASVLNGSQRNKDEYVKFSWNDLYILSISLLFHQLLAQVAGKKNKFISFRERSPDKHTQFQAKMFKIDTRFQTKTAQNHTYIPLPRAARSCRSQSQSQLNFRYAIKLKKQ